MTLMSNSALLRAMSIPGWNNENFNETFDPEVTIAETSEVNFDK